MEYERIDKRHIQVIKLDILSLRILQNQWQWSRVQALMSYVLPSLIWVETNFFYFSLSPMWVLVYKKKRVERTTLWHFVFNTIWVFTHFNYCWFCFFSFCAFFILLLFEAKQINLWSIKSAYIIWAITFFVNPISHFSFFCHILFVVI